MMHVRRCLVVAVLLFTLACNPFARRRTPAVLIPPAPIPAEPEEQVQELPQPPEIVPASSAPAPDPTESVTPLGVDLPPPPEPEVPGTPAPPTEPAPSAAPQLSPQLTQMLTHEEVERYNREIDQNLETVATLARTVSRRRLDDQSELALERVRALAGQAAEMRHRDLVTAHGLAARALMLARDLESRTR